MSLVTETLVVDEELGRGRYFLVLHTLESVSLRIESAIKPAADTVTPAEVLCFRL